MRRARPEKPDRFSGRAFFHAVIVLPPAGGQFLRSFLGSALRQPGIYGRMEYV